MNITTNFIPPLLIEMPEPNQQSERTCICALVDFSSFCDFDHLTFELWYFLFFILVVINSKLLLNIYKHVCDKYKQTNNGVYEKEPA
jgi:hypothetical protein